tara:strand:- start:721 stop:1461 length:741 start_codon:yes stop_codon:yes gene_type:complete
MFISLSILNGIVCSPSCYYLYFLASIFNAIKYPVNKKIVVRYPAGACGRFVGCLIESMRDPKFNYEIDNLGGIHTFNDENISDVVSHTHNLLMNIALDNLQTDLFIVQITVNHGWEDIVLLNYWTKCIKRFMDVNLIMDLTQKNLGWADKKWALDQLTKPRFLQTDQRLRDCMLDELRSHSDNHTSVIHDRILHMTHEDVISNQKLVPMLIDFLHFDNVDIHAAETRLEQYRSKQIRVKKLKPEED